MLLDTVECEPNLAELVDLESSTCSTHANHEQHKEHLTFAEQPVSATIEHGGHRLPRISDGAIAKRSEGIRVTPSIHLDGQHCFLDATMLAAHTHIYIHIGGKFDLGIYVSNQTASSHDWSCSPQRRLAVWVPIASCHLPRQILGFPQG